VLSLIRTTRLPDIIDTHQRLAADFSELRSAILPRLQRVEQELLDARLGRFFREFDSAILAYVTRGSEAACAVAAASCAAIAPLPRGRAGGLARARTAWRYLDGTFMPEAERAVAIEELELADYERYAAGGRARARTARRSEDGTFARSA
jgi:hypothetical protein